MKLSTTIQVDRVEERFESCYEHGIGEDAVFSERSLGWYVVFGGVSIHVGVERPPFLGGSRVKLTMESV